MCGVNDTTYKLKHTERNNKNHIIQRSNDILSYLLEILF